MALYAVLMTIAFLIAKATIIVLVRKLKHARFDINSLDYLFRQSKLAYPLITGMTVTIKEDNIIVHCDGMRYKPLAEFKKRLLNDLKKELDSVSVLSQSIKQLEEHSELDSTMRELDKELSLSPP